MFDGVCEFLSNIGGLSFEPVSSLYYAALATFGFIMFLGLEPGIVAGIVVHIILLKLGFDMGT